MRLLVSIPPSLRGESFADCPDSSLQHRLIRSWIEAGFKPISLNTPSELKANPSHRSALAKVDVELLEVPPTEHGFPAYLPNLVAALNLVVDRFPGEVIALTNADIHIALQESVFAQLRDLRSDCFFLSHRNDVADQALFDLPIERRHGREDSFLPGIDFVAARAEAFKAALHFLGDELTIGLPWWDLLLPMALLAAGATKQHLSSLQFLHLKHSDRWEARWLDRIGTTATRHLNSSIQGFRAPATAFVWSLAYQKLVSPLQSPQVMRSRLRTRLDYLRQRRSCPVYLYDVLRMTEGLVCEPGWSLDQRWIMAWQPLPPLQSGAMKPLETMK
jgi:hypothetical protein